MVTPLLVAAVVFLASIVGEHYHRAQAEDRVLELAKRLHHQEKAEAWTVKWYQSGLLLILSGLVFAVYNLTLAM